ncbi:homeodomain-interacting protein kinase 1-like [Mugil cephalus]|uniref:homeodomain-interacting protein kinase 1-like n=1 Tax=Mugil cephalus TaxID=48193 RepID=UPI001FB71683|nr:homeodomain-interacting protein kinase 1-like [Mugil cephalus]
MDSSSSSNSPIESSSNCHFTIPKGHRFVRVLGQGGYGTVLACVNEEREEPVAVKVFPESLSRHAQWEARIMKTLMQYDLDSSNIVRYQGKYSDLETTSLMYEMLDISLEDYMNTLRQPARLEDVRTIIQQMAVAFEALKSVGVIHGDLKLDNIMMVDHMRQPFRVKLIDFGLAMFRWNAMPGKTLQILDHRAPEILLGLPFSEAIDIWSLGCVMANLVLCDVLFPASNEYDVLRIITDLLGPPPDHLLKIGRNTRIFYKRIDGQWQLKTPGEYYQVWGLDNNLADSWTSTVSSLDQTKTMRLERDNPREEDERRECVELLKAMLQWDEKDRITPSGILKHPFITKSYLNNTSTLSGPSSSNQPEATTSQSQMDAGTQTEDKLV